MGKYSNSITQQEIRRHTQFASMKSYRK